jgi:probable rRNA maturation factor
MSAAPRSGTASRGRQAASRSGRIRPRVAEALRTSVQYAVARRGLPSAAAVRRIAALTAERAFAATVRFVGAREGRTLNALFRGKDYPTNVLTFVYDDDGGLTGDLVLCVPVLRREAKSQGKSVIAHCTHLLVHGLLHLQGYDHERAADAARMQRREVALLATLGFANPYAP